MSAERHYKIVKPEDKSINNSSDTPLRPENCANIPPEVKALVLDLRRRLNTLQDKFDDLCDTIKV